ncbi:DegT/DnrJ/EryC1/StrS aminotransferase family protein [Aliifodinibius sp. 1BSP15-2V2]|uniref:DegT/DnrJ/EryC1/StrS aminotransferase family protein n=2 Tax=Fodinibius salsisoli TaxID=2820877 RepID=A0ABT3PTE2_9BACT|nr:DegT/DnrJ/EryC1/StrS family aminotransferase [Fodinibius salsisoli]MCW9709125.1 DegT/DnrJ/EryC1/StrS aminotransferase family protein [Fodinibius salsisoli]
MYTPPAESAIPFEFSNSKDQITSFLDNEITYDGQFPILISKNARSLLRFIAKKILKPNDEVLLPAYTCESVIYAFIQNKIKLYDIEKTTLEPSLSSIKKNISENTRAILLQDLFGLNIDVERVLNFAQENELLVIYDSSQYLSTSSSDSNIKGDFQLYSFDRGKPLPLGMGGLLRINNEKFWGLEEVYNPSEVHRKIRFLLNLGLLQLGKNSVSYSLIEMLYLSKRDSIQKYKADEYTCSKIPFLKNVIADKNTYLKELNDHRKKVAALYSSSLDEELITANTSSIFIRFPIIHENDSIPEVLYRMGVRKMYRNNIFISKEFDNVSSNCKLKNSNFLEEFLITLPTHLGISKEIVHKISTLLKE